jgi:DNA-binding transcriptional LysR family regulator
MSPTPEAFRFASRAETLLADWERLRMAARPLHEMEGSHTIGCHPTVGLSALPKVVASLMRRYPKLSLNIETSVSREVQAAVSANRVDFGLVVNPVRTPELVLRPLATDHLMLWMDSSLATGKRSIRLDIDVDLLFLDPDLFQSHRLLNAFQEAGAKFNRILKVRGLDLVAALASDGGYAFLPARVAVRHPKLVPAFSVAIQTARAGAKKNPTAPEFVDHFALAYRDVLLNDKSSLKLARELEKDIKAALSKEV